MKLFTLRGTTVRIHPLFLLTCGAYVLYGQGTLLLAYLIALLLHEAGHYFIARRFRLPVSLLEITPFGGAMQIDLAEGLSPGKSFLLSSGGIIANAALLLCSLFCLFTPLFSVFMLSFTLANLSMLLINLLPFLPLDGGRMLLALLSCKLERPPAFRLLLILGRVAALFMIVYPLSIAIAQGEYHFSLLVLGCYLLYASALEEKHTSSRYLAALISRRLKFERGTALSVQHLCVPSDLSLHALLPQLAPNAYHLVEIVDPASGHIHGRVSEETLLKAVLDTPFVTMQELLSKP